MALQNSPAGAFLPVLRSESMGTPALPDIVPDLNLTTITGLRPDPAEKKGEKGKGKKKATTNSSQIRTIIKVPFKCQGIFLASA